MLSSGLKFDAVISNNDEMALGAINALKAAKKWTPDFMVAGVDATPDALASMKAGDLKVTVFQNGQTLTVSVNAAGMAAGTYQSTVVLTAGGVLQALPVTLTVGPPTARNGGFAVLVQILRGSDQPRAFYGVAIRNRGSLLRGP